MKEYLLDRLEDALKRCESESRQIQEDLNMGNLLEIGHAQGMISGMNIVIEEIRNTIDLYK